MALQLLFAINSAVRALHKLASDNLQVLGRAARAQARASSRLQQGQQELAGQVDSLERRIDRLETLMARLAGDEPLRAPDPRQLEMRERAST